MNKDKTPLPITAYKQEILALSLMDVQFYYSLCLSEMKDPNNSFSQKTYFHILFNLLEHRLKFS